MAKFARDLEHDTLKGHSDQERVQMLKVIKRELRRYSYLTMSKNVSTADQIIKTIEINGGKYDSDNYTVNQERELLRKTKYVRILMNLFKELEFDDWHSITVETL
jgi:predicted RNA-binding protein with EMAP domain